MPIQSSIRPAVAADTSALAAIADAVLFPGNLLAPMIEPVLSGTATGLWLVAESGEGPTGFAFAEPEHMTEGTWNLRALAVRSDLAGQGIGTCLVRGIETALDRQAGRLILIDTTGLPEQERARRLYSYLGYVQEATIRDFFSPGEDKVTFTKRL